MMRYFQISSRCRQCDWQLKHLSQVHSILWLPILTSNYWHQHPLHNHPHSTATAVKLPVSHCHHHVFDTFNLQSEVPYHIQDTLEHNNTSSPMENYPLCLPHCISGRTQLSPKPREHPDIKWFKFCLLFSFWISSTHRKFKHQGICCISSHLIKDMVQLNMYTFIPAILFMWTTR